MKIKFNYQNLLIFLFLTSAFALILAYISQYIFGLEPCNLCFYQRKPFFVVIAISAIFLLVKNFKKWQKIAIYFAILAIVFNAFLAFYHVGVENKFFAGPTTCSGTPSQPTDLEELTKIIMSTPAVRCDKPAFLFLGISMAGWNGIYCLFLVIFSIFFLRKARQ